MMPKNQFSSGYQIRAAIATDIWAIRWLVLRAFLDPTQLRWSQFWVAEAAGEIIACGQLRQFNEAQELGSLVVAPRWQGQGLATHLTQVLINQATGPLFLECVGERLARFYQRFGFVSVIGLTLPPQLERKYRLTQRLGRLLGQTVHVLYYPPSLQGGERAR